MTLSLHEEEAICSSVLMLFREEITRIEHQIIFKGNWYILKNTVFLSLHIFREADQVTKSTQSEEKVGNSFENIHILFARPPASVDIRQWISLAKSLIFTEPWFFWGEDNRVRWKRKKDKCKRYKKCHFLSGSNLSL